MEESLAVVARKTDGYPSLGVICAKCGGGFDGGDEEVDVERVNTVGGGTKDGDDFGGRGGD